MLDLKDVFYSVQVVDRDGFTSASKSLRIPKSALSHRVQQLDASLGIRLDRTSRRFGMTDVGREFYSHALTMWAVQPRTDEGRQVTKSRHPIDRRGQSAKRVRVCRRRRDARGALVAGLFEPLQRAGVSSPFPKRGPHTRRTPSGVLGGERCICGWNTHRFPSRATGERSISQGRFKQELG